MNSSPTASSAVHPREWAAATTRTRELSTSTRQVAAGQRAQAVRTREVTDLALSTADSRVQLALKQRIEETQQAIQHLQDEHAHLCSEIDALENAREALVADLDAKRKLSALPHACLTTRSTRPPPERVRDKAEHALVDEARQFADAVAVLEQELRTAEQDLRRLRSAKFRLEQDLRDKQGALEADLKVNEIRSATASP